MRIRTNIPTSPRTSQAICRTTKKYPWPNSFSAVTADALKIITAPNRQSTTVTPNSQRSISRRLGTFAHPFRGSRPGRLLFELPHQTLEDTSAVLIILKLIEAGAGRREQHHVAGPRGMPGGFHGALQRFRALQSYAS